MKRINITNIERLKKFNKKQKHTLSFNFFERTFISKIREHNFSKIRYVVDREVLRHKSRGWRKEDNINEYYAREVVELFEIDYILFNKDKD